MSLMDKQTGSEIAGDVVYLTYDRTASGEFTSELQKAGYQIKITASLGETILCLRQPNFGALVVGPLVKAADKALLASELKRRNSSIKVIFLYRDAIQNLPGADAALNVHGGGDALLRTIRKLLSPRS